MTREQAVSAMEAALAEAEAALAEGEVPVGAVIARDGRILARDHNRREQTGDPTAHAEMLAIRAAARELGSRRLEGCFLAVTLEPCCMCAGAAAAAGLEGIVYGADDPRAGCCGSVYALTEDPALAGKRVPVHAGVCREACAELLERFFRQKRMEGS